MVTKKIRVALAGNANVGKSVIFNLLTGLHQHIGNWPGKTIERSVGSVYAEGYEIEIIDLPGIYSLSTFSVEELISREFILSEKPDVIVNVVDASVLERNLFFTLQLFELNLPTILVVNQIDIAKSKGITIDTKQLEKLIEIPVIPSIATRGTGLTDILKYVVDIYEGKRNALPQVFKYGHEIESQIARLSLLIEMNNILPTYPTRWLAFKILERDEEIIKEVKDSQKERLQNYVEPYNQPEGLNSILDEFDSLIGVLEEFHGHSYASIIASERYEVINGLVSQVQQIKEDQATPLRERLDSVLLHPVYGYFILLSTVLILLFGIFYVGDFFSSFLDEINLEFKSIYYLQMGSNAFSDLIWAGIEGFLGGISIALPYILPFYFILGLLEDSGYMTRIAFMMDRLMHVIGLHGKAFIPCMLSIGCNVPACLGCRIMERKRDRMLAVFIVTLIPCAAQTIIILALVGKFIGFFWVIFLYILDVVIIVILGKIALKVLPGEPMGLIMEMVTLKKPNIRVVVTQTWFRLKEFLTIALPLIIIGSIFLKLLEIFYLLEEINFIFSPVIVNLLGLPEEVGVALLFGIARKELAVILLGTLFGTMNFLSVMTPVQMIVYSLFTMLYIPCLATIAALKKELQWKKTLIIITTELVLAITLATIVRTVLQLLYDHGIFF